MSRWFTEVEIEKLKRGCNPEDWSQFLAWAEQIRINESLLQAIMNGYGFVIIKNGKVIVKKGGY